MQSAATGKKNIYFDADDNMYTEQEMLNRRLQRKTSKQELTKMRVRVPEKDR